MKKIFLALLLLCSSVFAQPTYNAIATAYVTTTISQQVVFNSAMQQGGTFTFSVLAHNGGGRAGQADTANVKIQFYTAGGTLLSTVNSNHSSNLPNPNQAPGNPWADPSVPWSTLTVSSTNCGGSCANVAYATVSMYGVDGSFWAGDYGPWYRAPTFQKDGGTNLLYNPEFGPAYGYNAQGWTTNPGMGACQGAWGGSNPCIVNSDGTPGQSTVGLVANQNGGGPSTSGGTTSGTAGGYNNSMSTTNAGAGTGTPQTPPPPTTDWKTIKTNSTPVVISNIYPTSNNSPAGEGAGNAFDGNTGTKYLNFDKKNAGVTVKLSQGRVVQKFTLTTANDFEGRDPTSYKLYGSNDGVNWVLIKQDTVALSNQRFWTSPEIMVANTTAYVYYFILFPTTKSGDGCGLNCDSMQIAEITFYYDLNDGVTSTATGSGGTPSNPGTAGSICADCGPTVVGGTITQTNAPSNQTIQSGGTYVDNSSRAAQQTRINSWANSAASYSNAVYVDQVGGDDNNVTISLSGTKNRVELTLDGAGTNTIGITQVGSNYLKADVNGYQNSLTTSQTNTIGSNYAETTINGNNNVVNHTQSNNNNRLLFSTINGNNNTLSTTQSGSGQHYLDVRMTGNGHNVLVNQYGANANNAQIDVTNAGGAATVDLEQGGGKSFTLIQSCAILSGCNTTVKQQ
jgi:hypothetical protein